MKYSNLPLDITDIIKQMKSRGLSITNENKATTFLEISQYIHKTKLGLLRNVATLIYYCSKNVFNIVLFLKGSRMILRRRCSFALLR